MVPRTAATMMGVLLSDVFARLWEVQDGCVIQRIKRAHLELADAVELDANGPAVDAPVEL